jgi:D-galactarolactone isomerase
VEPESDSVLALGRLLETGSCWLKISAPYESSRSGPPGYVDIAWIARLFARRFPERCLWASNWPHPNQVPPPLSATLLDWGLGCMADSASQRKALVDNPAELYGFAPVAAT